MKISHYKSAILILCIAIAGLVQAASMTSAIRDEIKKQAVAKWPDDFSMQAYHIKDQTESFEKFQTLEKPASMSTSTFQLIKDRAERKWPKDYAMQLYDLKIQIEGWIKVNGK
jgi:hypothetical protein